MARSRFSKFQKTKKKRSSVSSNENLTADELTCSIVSLSHEGRGVSKHNGKIRFIEGALPGETVKARFISQHAKFDELVMTEIIEPSPDRVPAPCAHFDVCGGCNLQHMDVVAQINHKQAVLKEQLTHFGKLSPVLWMDVMTSQTEGYRSKARLGVFYDKKQQKVLLGFREKSNKVITDVDRCLVLDSRVSGRLLDLKNLVASLSSPAATSHIEVAAGDTTVALLFRQTSVLDNDDKSKLIEFAKLFTFDLYLQAGVQERGVNTVIKLWPAEGMDRLSYSLVYTELKSESELDLSFHPKDFTQVNRPMNRKMVLKALECLALTSRDRVLDLFCGLGNFTLPIAKFSASVVGVEGSENMVQRAYENAEKNGIDNVSFFASDLQSDFTKQAWATQVFDKALIDPPRSGALEIVKYLAELKINRIVYISCNPATLSRDAGVLIKKGYTLSQVGVLDMFPHTAHVESIALFDRIA